ncbi:hypothetical protein MLD38_040556 [Melastoma candidum]|nr:hypothetical protein MLD38_040556 [Melastoma candidum]
MNDLKSLAADKRAAQKVQDTPSREAKDATPAVSSKATKSLPSKKIERPERGFCSDHAGDEVPPRFFASIVPELKARFARFGPLDSSRIQVLWKSLTCRVVFQHKSDAEAAHNYAVGNGSLFGAQA